MRSGKSVAWRQQWSLSAVGALLACVVSWLLLAMVAGNVGLQRTVSTGPETLLASPLSLLVPLAGAFGTSYAWSRRFGKGSALPFTVALIGWNLLGALILAPAAVGEVTVQRWREVLITITLFGTQILAAGLGWWIALRSAVPRSPHEPS